MEVLLEGSSRTYLYTEPISISDRSEEPYELAGINARYTKEPYLPVRDQIFKGTVVRAKAIKDKALSPNTHTQSYFISPAGAGRYHLPVVSITTDAASGLSHQLNVSALPSGVYVLEVATQQSVQHRKISIR